MNPAQRDKRFSALREIGCIACFVSGHGMQCGRVEIHHLNSFGLAGKKRLGDEYTIPLGAYAHRGVLLPNHTGKLMRSIFGPSLAGEPKAFRSVFGADEDLLELTNKQLEAL